MVMMVKVVLIPRRCVMTGCCLFILKLKILFGLKIFRCRPLILRLFEVKSILGNRRGQPLMLRLRRRILLIGVIVLIPCWVMRLILFTVIRRGR